MADDFNNVNYDGIFNKKPKSNPLETVSSIGSRIGQIIFGTMFGGIALSAAIMLIFFSYKDIVKNLNHQTAIATIASIDGSLEDSEITINWSFVIDDKTYAGRKTANESSHQKLYDTFSQYKTGEQIIVSYDPANPQNNDPYKPFNPAILFMLLFTVPFIATGFMIVTGKLKKEKSVEPGTKDYAAVICIIGLFLLCCPAAFLFAFLGEKTSPYISISLFLAYVILIPFIIRSINCKLKKTTHARQELVQFQTESHVENKSCEQAGNLSHSSFKKEVCPLLFFSLVWWFLLGIFTVIMGYQAHKYLTAKATYERTTGTMLSSRVAEHYSNNSTTYSPEIKYIYYVNGKKYIGKKYDVTGGSSSGSWAYNIVRKNPKGQKVTVYYDPANPSKAVISIAPPEMLKAFLFFLQPFFAAGVLIILATIKTTKDYFKLKRLLSLTDQLQPNIKNLWAKPEIGADSLKISFKNKPSICTTFISSYCMVTFAMIFIMAFKYGFEMSLEQTLTWIKIALSISVVGVILSIIKYIFSRPEVLTIDRVTGEIVFESKKENWRLSLSDIKNLRLKIDVSSFQRNNKQVKIYRLEAIDKSNMWHTIHQRKISLNSDWLLLNKSMLAGRTLAAFIGCPMDDQVEINDRNKKIPPFPKKFIKIPDKIN